MSVFNFKEKYRKEKVLENINKLIYILKDGGMYLEESSS